MDYSLLYLSLLIIVGFIAGIINTIAGGGSNLTLPTLMMTGMPADVANATNRVAVFLQCLVGASTYKKHNKLDSSDLLPVLIPCTVGGLVGAGLAVYLPVTLLKPLLLGTMLGMTLLILIRPGVVAPPEGTVPYKMNRRPQAWLGLFIAGLYGGFVQAGVGFILIAALAGSLRYDLVRTNALKLVCVLVFTGIALLAFIWKDLILWLPGLVLAVGNMVGAVVAVKISLNVSQNTMKWFLFVMTLVACIAAMFS